MCGNGFHTLKIHINSQYSLQTKRHSHAPSVKFCRETEK
jgi:hypothetical protein